MRVRPSTKPRAVSAVSILCSTLIRSSGSKLHLGAAADLGSEVRAQVLRCPQIDSTATEQVRQLLFDPCQAKKTRCSAGLEFHQQIDGSVR